MSADDILQFEPPVALVVFTPENGHWLSHLLHRERKHCFAVVPSAFSAGVSLEIDLKLAGIVMGAARGSPEDLYWHYLDQGLEVVRVPYEPEKRQLLPMMLNNCVGLTKQVIGIRCWALTPHQLWRHLRRTMSCEHGLT